MEIMYYTKIQRETMYVMKCAIRKFCVLKLFKRKGVFQSLMREEEWCLYTRLLSRVSVKSWSMTTKRRRVTCFTTLILTFPIMTLKMPLHCILKETFG